VSKVDQLKRSVSDHTTSIDTMRLSRDAKVADVERCQLDVEVSLHRLHVFASLNIIIIQYTINYLTQKSFLMHCSFEFSEKRTGSFFWIVFKIVMESLNAACSVN